MLLVCNFYMKEVKTQKEIIEKIRNGEIGVLPTDTIYGLVCLAYNKEAIENIYKIKSRDLSKPFIYLISEISQLKSLGVDTTNEEVNKIGEVWPGPVSIEFKCNDNFEYLHRGTGTIGVRMPDNDFLLKIISEVGPIVATSVNREGEPSANSIEDVMFYFSDSKLINFYFDAGIISKTASKIIKINEGGEVEVIRE